jgi:exopolyphosphatase/guanosine-5'-triphosphate,3'-diphosphate pyrophosphatase
MMITRLGEGLEAGGAIRPAAAARTAAAVEDFVALAESSGAPPPAVVGTYALRIARNPEELFTRLSVPVRVLEGEEEARLGFCGALAGLRSLTPATGMLVVDIGGGSVEITHGTPQGVIGSVSLPLGAVTLTQQFLGHDPPRDAEVAAVQSYLAHILDPHLSRLRGRRFRLIGVGGTITTMAALAQHLDPYDPDRVHGFRLRVPVVDAITADLFARPLADRRLLRGLQPERADIIPAGALVVQHIVRTLGRRFMTVSEADLLWAVVLDL